MPRYLALLLSALLLLTQSTSAQQQAPLTASAIIDQLEQRLGGRVIALQTSTDGKRYRVRLLTAKAEVRVLDIDAITGKSLGPVTKP